MTRSPVIRCRLGFGRVFPHSTGPLLYRRPSTMLGALSSGGLMLNIYSASGQRMFNKCRAKS
jgi:hypothetical protein